LLGIVCAHEDCDVGLDIILGAAWVGLGFAALENVLYVLQAKDVYTTGLVRAVLAVPQHVSQGTVMGCCLVMARQQGRWKPYWAVAALLLPILLHGIYDSAVFSRELTNSGALSVAGAEVFAGIVVVAAGLIAIWSVRVIAKFGASRLHGRGLPIGAFGPTRAVQRVGRRLAIGVLGLLALIFVVGALASWPKSPIGALIVGATSILMLGYTVFFWLGPVKFEQDAQHLYGE
jgi:hypothetical protein